MVFDGSGEVRLGIEEACNSCVLFCNYLHDFWRNEDIWGGLMTESFNGGGTCITCDYNSLLFELLYFILKHWLPQGVFCEELDGCWQTEDRWGGLMTELFNVEETDITGDYNSLLFEWLSLRLKHRLSRGVVRCLSWLLTVPILWQLPIRFERGMMNAIWVCGAVVWLLFCLLMATKRREQKFWRNNCSHVWVSVSGIKLIKIFLSH